jgi:hypothetical protein
MTEVNAGWLYHRNNVVPHFHSTVRGSWDTVPVWVLSAPHRYQPKYERNVVKYNVIVCHTGHIAYLSGGHPGAMSDTTLARSYIPPLLPTDTLLADLAYVSVPHCLTPIKKPNNGVLTNDQVEFNRIVQYYRARSEHSFGWMKNWQILNNRYRSHSLTLLNNAFVIIASLRNIIVSVRMPYPVPQDEAVASVASE